VTDRERYLFDLQGFLVVPGVLQESDVRTLNELLDAYSLWENAGVGRFRGVWANDADFIVVGHLHEWDEPFVKLLDHPRTLPYLVELVGADLRYDHGHALLMRRGATSLRLHGGGTPYIPSESYRFADGRMHNGLVAVSIALTEAEACQGGFAAIPGSHKANLPCPPDIKNFTDIGPWVVRVDVRPGDAIFFTEALTHGTWPWVADHERRSVLLKYTPGHMAFGDPALPDSAAPQLEGARQRLLRRPYVPAREPVVSVPAGAR